MSEAQPRTEMHTQQGGAPPPAVYENIPKKDFKK
jgi:hypothetical protein